MYSYFMLTPWMYFFDCSFHRRQTSAMTRLQLVALCPGSGLLTCAAAMSRRVCRPPTSSTCSASSSRTTAGTTLSVCYTRAVVCMSTLISILGCYTVTSQIEVLFGIDVLDNLVFLSFPRPFFPFPLSFPRRKVAPKIQLRELGSTVSLSKPRP